MSILHSSKAYVYNLQTTSSAEAKRLWRKDVKEKWHYKCAYCGDGNNLTIDHVFQGVKVEQTLQKMLFVVALIVIRGKDTNLGSSGF